MLVTFEFEKPIAIADTTTAAQFIKEYLKVYDNLDGFFFMDNCNRFTFSVNDPEKWENVILFGKYFRYKGNRIRSMILND